MIEAPAYLSTIGLQHVDGPREQSRSILNLRITIRLQISMITPPRKLGWQARGIARSHNDDDDDDFSLWFVKVESVIIADREARSPTSLKSPTCQLKLRSQSTRVYHRGHIRIWGFSSREFRG